MLGKVGLCLLILLHACQPNRERRKTFVWSTDLKNTWWVTTSIFAWQGLSVAIFLLPGPVFLS